jgi:hypothetical protein
MVLSLGALAKLRKATVSYVVSLRLSAWNGSALAGRIVVKFDILVSFENLLRKFELIEI